MNKKKFPLCFFFQDTLYYEKQIGIRMDHIKKTGSPAYLEALKKLTRLIHAEYPDGGKLPGAPEMCRRLGICMVTYIKILKILSKESLLVTSKGRGGTYIPPKNERRRKIGIVVRNAEESPFFGEIPVMTEALKTLNNERFVLHLLQASRVEDIYEKALIHAVEGILWFNPDVEAVPAITQIQRGTDIPIMTLDLWTREPRHLVEQENINCVMQDSEWEYELIADYAVQNGHTSILRIDKPNEVYSNRFMEALRQKGIPFTPDRYILPGNIRKQLPGKLSEKHPTLLISEGGFAVYRQICELLSALPEQERPAMLIRDAGNLPEKGIKKLYPGIRFAGTMKSDFKRIGREGALMMVRHLRNGEPLCQKKIRCFSIQP